MDHNDNDFEGMNDDLVYELLDYHLDQLEPDDRARMARELRSNPQMEEMSLRIADVLIPLDSWTVPSAPSALPDRVLRYVERNSRKQAASAAAVSRGGWRDRSRGFPGPAARDVLAAAACVLLLLSVMLPGLSEIRDRSRLTRCAGHLGEVYRGLGGYLADFHESLPFAGSAAGAAWLLVPRAPRYESNSRHVYRLMKGRYVAESDHFVCPASRTDQPMRLAKVENLDDFLEAGNISYSSLNLAGPDSNVRPPTPIAYLSDPNPIFAGGRFHENINPDTANSPTHNGTGQNVLVTDGRVELMDSPYYGAQRDNIWLAGDTRLYLGWETPAGKNDSFVVPGVPRTDPMAQAAISDSSGW